ncbi:hypothetical protein EVAR_78491_1 [Eumeta japonica]|uniref:Uncharacterized protein n=1 Tax=Eumeta variegata TaxID=151549 RepID=A0A4C1TY88_EUMVA|nr:hypothetical protein EVAR_78491_1 [Eumeta japonica]
MDEKNFSKENLSRIWTDFVPLLQKCVGSNYVKISTSADSTGAPSNSWTLSPSLGIGEVDNLAAVVDVPSNEQTALDELNSGDREGSLEVDSDWSESDRDVDESWLPPRSITERECQSKVTQRHRRI